METTQNLASIAEQVGFKGPSILQKVMRGDRHLSFEKAVDVELATQGELRFEDLVRPEVVDALDLLHRLPWRLCD